MFGSSRGKDRQSCVMTTVSLCVRTIIYHGEFYYSELPNKFIGTLIYLFVVGYGAMIWQYCLMGLCFRKFFVSNFRLSEDIFWSVKISKRLVLLLSVWGLHHGPQWHQYRLLGEVWIDMEKVDAKSCGKEYSFYQRIISWLFRVQFKLGRSFAIKCDTFNVCWANLWFHQVWLITMHIHVVANVLGSFAFLWCKMPMFLREGMKEGRKPLPLAFQYMIFMV